MSIQEQGQVIHKTAAQSMKESVSEKERRERDRGRKINTIAPLRPAISLQIM